MVSSCPPFDDMRKQSVYNKHVLLHLYAARIVLITIFGLARSYESPEIIYLAQCGYWSKRTLGPNQKGKKMSVIRAETYLPAMLFNFSFWIVEGR